MKEFLKKYKIPIIIYTLTLIIILISIPIILKKELFIDKLAYNIFVKKLRNPSLTNIMKIITSLSNTTTIVIITIILLIFIKNKKIAITIPINISLVAILNRIIKSIIKRPRPSGYRLLKIGGYSFPSGHAMASMAFYGLLIYLSYKFIKNEKLKKLSIILNIIIIILVGISRIYLGVHFLSDILVGYSVSIIYLIIYIKILKKLKVIT
jgi:undecaprenyl-diphosphatase